MKTLLLIAMLALPASAEVLLHDDTIPVGEDGALRVTVTDLEDGRFRYTYTSDAWPHGTSPDPEWKMLPKSGRFSLFREDGGKVAKRFARLTDAKQLSLFKAEFRTPIDGLIEITFLTRSQPVRGRAGWSFEMLGPEGKTCNRTHVPCWIPGPK